MKRSGFIAIVSTVAAFFGVKPAESKSATQLPPPKRQVIDAFVPGMCELCGLPRPESVYSVKPLLAHISRALWQSFPGVGLAVIEAPGFKYELIIDAVHGYSNWAYAAMLNMASAEVEHRRIAGTQWDVKLKIAGEA